MSRAYFDYKKYKKKMRHIYFLGGCMRIGKTSSAVRFINEKSKQGEPLEFLDTDDVMHGLKEFSYMSRPNLKNQTIQLLPDWVLEYIFHQNNIGKNIIIAALTPHLTLQNIDYISSKLDPNDNKVKQPVIVGYNNPDYFEAFRDNLARIDDWFLYENWQTRKKKTMEQLRNDFIGLISQSNFDKNKAMELKFKYLDVTDRKEFPNPNDFDKRQEKIVQTLLNL